MKYLKKFESYNINESVPGGIGAIAGGLHKSKAATKEEASDKPNEFLCDALVNPIMKKWGKFNCTISECKINKVEQKKGFLNKMFSGSSTIEFHLKSERLSKPIKMILKLKGDKFVLSGDSGDTGFVHGHVSSESADKFIKYLLNTSEYKEELKEKFENIGELLTKECFE